MKILLILLLLVIMPLCAYADQVGNTAPNFSLSDMNGKVVSVAVPPLPPGSYKVMWSVVARDGHPTTGEYTFTIK